LAGLDYQDPDISGCALNAPIRACHAEWLLFSVDWLVSLLSREDFQPKTIKKNAFDSIAKETES
jgi:hypothetical protein